MEELTYKEATLQDYDDFYRIKGDPENVKWSDFVCAPDYERMKEWFRQQLEGKKRTIYLCYLNGEVCGFFYLDKLNDSNLEETGCGVLSEFSGRGIGTTIVRFAKKLCESQELCAWVSEKNGFEKHEINTLRTLALFKEEQKFFLETVVINESFNQNADVNSLSSVVGGERITPHIYAAFYNYAA